MNDYVEVPVTSFYGEKTKVGMNINYKRFSHIGKSVREIDLSPLTGTKDLRFIELSENRIQSIDLSPVAGFSFLQELDLSRNEIESIDLTPLAKCLKLETLNLSSNQLLELDLTPLATCRSLKEISLSTNFLKELDLSVLELCTRLESISLDMNDLKTLDLSPVIESPRLKSLRCDPHLQIRVNPVLWNIRVGRDAIIEEPEVRSVDFRILHKPVPVARDLGEDQRTTSDILKGDEEQKTEFKSSFRLDLKSKNLSESLKHEVIRTVCGFMNSDGGVLLIGVADNKTVVGIQDELKRVKGKNRDGYELVLRKAIEDAIGRKNEVLLQIQFEPWGDKEICRIDVMRSVTGQVFLKPKKGDQEFWVRFGNSTKKLTGEEMVDYIRESWPELFVKTE